MVLKKEAQTMLINTKYMEPLTDYGFKKIFASEGSEMILKSFLFHLLELDALIAEVTILSPEQLPGRPHERIGVYDLYCIDELDQRFIVEMQKKKHDYLKDRLVYYSSFPISHQAQKGEWSYELDPIYCLGILDFNMFPDERCIRYAKLTDIATGELYYDKLTYVTVELRKFNLSLEELETGLDKWLYFLRHLTDFNQIPEELSDEPFQAAFHIAEMAALTEEEWYFYEGSLKVMRDDFAVRQTAEREQREAKAEGIAAGRAEGITAGRAEGITAGRAEGITAGRAEGEMRGRKAAQIEMAEKLIQNQMPIETVVEITGLTQAELEELIPSQESG
jgi:predicted transposase/invertase (TIGR01784 family)